MWSKYLEPCTQLEDLPGLRLQPSLGHVIIVTWGISQQMEVFSDIAFQKIRFLKIN